MTTVPKSPIPATTVPRASTPDVVGTRGMSSIGTTTGVGRPDSTDPEVVSQHVLSRFTEPAADVRALIERAADETERLLEREYAAGEKPA